MYLDEQLPNALNIASGIDEISVDSHEGACEDENISVHSDAIPAESSSISENSGQSSRVSSRRINTTNVRPPFGNVISRLQEESKKLYAESDESTTTTTESEVRI